MVRIDILNQPEQEEDVAPPLGILSVQARHDNLFNADVLSLSASTYAHHALGNQAHHFAARIT